MIKTMTELCVSSTVDTPRATLISLTSRKGTGGRSKKGHKASRRSWRVGRSSGGGDAPPADDAGRRWDGADLHAWSGSYGDYLTAKVAKVFPDLFAEVVGRD